MNWRAYLVPLARLSVFAEATWPLLWPAVALVLGFIGLAFFDPASFLPQWLHVLLLVVFAAALAVAAWHAVRGIRLPSREAGERRVEHDGELTHRPLAALKDTLGAGSGDRFAEGLWRAHLRQAALAAQNIRLKAPRLGLSRIDPIGFRAGIVMLLIIGVVVGRGDLWNRLERTLSPEIGAAAAEVPTQLEAWITPPGYTGRAPAYLQAGTSKDRLEVVEGSKLMARVTGPSRTPVLDAAGQKTDFAALGGTPAVYQLEATVTGGDMLEVRSGGTVLGHWPIAVHHDTPPTIALTDQPNGDSRGRLSFGFKADDDFGIAETTATIRHGSDEPLRFALPVNREKSDKPLRVVRDLTPHPWAGLPVTMTLEAKDTKGQSAETQPVQFTLPERPFRNPVAREIIAARRELGLQGAPAASQVGDMLMATMARPGRYNGDVVVFLALRSSISRLAYQGQSKETIDSVRSLLWDTALRVEEGNRATASRDLDKAEEALQKAIDEGADSKEIERLTQELKEAMARFMEQLMRDMARNGPMPPFDTSMMPTANMQDLNQMLDQMRQAATTGSRDAAREMLSQLRQMLEALRNAKPMDPNNQQMREANELMRQLGDLVQRQKELADRTLQARERDRDARSDKELMDAMRQMMGEQEQLRQQLGEAMRRAGEMTGNIPDNLGKAERAMKDAGQALGAGQADQAIGSQAEALRQLQQGRESTRQALGQQMGMGFAFNPMGRGGGMQQGRDPFGRASGGTRDGQGVGAGDVQIPDKDDMQRSREILEDLRNRANDPRRSQSERDYIRRLLQFY